MFSIDCGVWEVIMPLFNINNDRILISVTDEVVDEEGKNYWIEIKLAKILLKRLFDTSTNDIRTDINSNILFTRRETQVLSYIAQGKNNYQISKELNVSVHTTKAHIQNIFKKLSVKDRTVAVVKAIKDNLIDI